MTDPMPGPWVDYEGQQAAPWSTNEGVIKLIEFPVRNPAMSRRAFHLYWMKHHSPHVMNVTPFAQFIRKYSTAHICAAGDIGLPARYSQATPFEGAAEVWINSLDEVGAWLSHPLYDELIRPDEARFMCQDGSVEVILAKESRIYEAEPDLNENGLIKVYLLLKRHADILHDEFHETLCRHGSALVDPRWLRRLVVSHRIRAPWPEGFTFAEIDAVLEIWFSRIEDIREYFGSPAYLAAARQCESGCTGVERIRAIVAKVCVVHDEFSFQPTIMQPLQGGWSY